MHYIPVKKIIFVSLFVLSMFPFTVLAEVNCINLPHWVTLNNGLHINQKHIFCGEWKKDRPKGFHSRPDGHNPLTVARFTIQDRPNAAGIYTSKWSYLDHPNKNKFSSMFPDSCSKEQVLNSISHAAAHPNPQCPAGSPDWLTCGQNRPSTLEKNSLNYCNKDNVLFTIGFATPKDGTINTAFPLY